MSRTAQENWLKIRHNMTAFNTHSSIHLRSLNVLVLIVGGVSVLSPVESLSSMTMAVLTGVDHLATVTRPLELPPTTISLLAFG